MMMKKINKKMEMNWWWWWWWWTNRGINCGKLRKIDTQGGRVTEALLNDLRIDGFLIKKKEKKLLPFFFWMR